MKADQHFWREWSASHQAVHLATEQAALANNLRAFQENRPVDYVPLAVFPDEKAATAFLSEVQSVRDRRQLQARRQAENGGHHASA